jgi:dihydrofolate reductase
MVIAVLLPVASSQPAGGGRAVHPIRWRKEYGDIVLDASVLPRSMTGATDVRAFFGATRAMFDAITFKHEVIAGSRTYLEWEGTFQGNNIAGLTVLTKDVAGLIESIRVYYRPYKVVVAFSADLAGRLAGNMTVDPFLRSALPEHP